MVRNRANTGLLRGVVRFLLFLIALAAGSEARADQILLSAQIGGDIHRTRYVAFLSKKVAYRIFSIADPYRIVVDLPEVDIQVPGEKGRGLILSSRSGLLAAGKSRMVIDLVEPALIEKAELLPPENELPARLVIDLVRTSHKAFLAAAKIPPPVQRADASRSAAIAKIPKTSGHSSLSIPAMAGSMRERMEGSRIRRKRTLRSRLERSWRRSSKRPAAIVLL